MKELLEKYQLDENIILKNNIKSLSVISEGSFPPVMLAVYNDNSEKRYSGKIEIEKFLISLF